MSRELKAGIAGPIGEKGRIDSMDVLRGAAIFGILMVNMQYHAMPIFKAFMPLESYEAAPGEWLSWGFVSAFFELKFIAIFSLLFGMGFALQQERFSGNATMFRLIYRRRLALLFAMGLVHGCVLFSGDILLPYAIAGTVLYLCRRMNVEKQLLLGFGLVLFAAFMGGMLELIPEDAAAADKVRMEVPLTALEVLHVAATGNLEVLGKMEMETYVHGPIGPALLLRMIEYLLYLLTTCVSYLGWRVLGIFFIGSALLRLGIFHPDRTYWFRRMRTCGFAVGLPSMLIVTGIHIRGGEIEGLMEGVLSFYYDIGSLFLSAGYVGAIVLWSRSSKDLFARGLASAGRTALTNYLAQSVIMVTLMSGFGLFGSLSRQTQILLALVVFAVQLGISILWMQFFKTGPLEWIWRSVTYGRIVPILRR